MRTPGLNYFNDPDDDLEKRRTDRKRGSRLAQLGVLALGAALASQFFPLPTAVRVVALVLRLGGIVCMAVGIGYLARGSRFRMPWPPGWYPDPTQRHELRYFTKGEWTRQVSDRGVLSVETDLREGPSPR